MLSPAYEAAVRAWASGDHAGAFAAVAAFSEGALIEQLGALRALWSRARACRACYERAVWDAAPILAALMLHTDASRAGAAAGGPRLNERMARSLADLMRSDPARSDFAERWYGVMCGIAVGENRFEDGLRWAEHGLDAFPGSAELLVAKSAIEETFGLEAVNRLETVLDPSSRQTRLNLARFQAVRRHLELAREALRDAVAARPSLAEAWLRLGRVAWRLGDEREAREALVQALERAQARETTYLAHLFLGRLLEDEGRFEDASRSYESALTITADAQAARLALSHARMRLGDAAAARRHTEAALAAAGARPRPDPFWDYPWGPAVGVEERLLALRREASP